ncbi:MAG: cortexillin II [Christensenellales bacterium]
MARGKQKAYPERIAEVSKEIEKMRDKKTVVSKEIDAKIAELEEGKKLLEQEYKMRQLEELKAAIESSGMTIEEAIKKFKEK